MYIDGQINVSGTHMHGTFSDNERGYSFTAMMSANMDDFGLATRLTFDNPTQLTGAYAFTGRMGYEGIDMKLINDKQETLTLTTPGQQEIDGEQVSGRLSWRQ